MTTAKRNIHSALSYLLLLYFVVYAVSPLSYTYTAGKIAGRTCGADAPFAFQDNLNIFLLEFICAKMDAKKDADQTNSTVRVLIRKARAILPENTHLRSIPLDGVALSEYSISYPYDCAAGIAVSPHGLYCTAEFNSLHSGPSPPSA